MGATAGILFTAGGGGFQASSQWQAGNAQSKVDLYNAQVAANNAKVDALQSDDAIARGSTAETVHRKQVKALIGSQRASLAASGVDVNDGSALDVQTDSARQGETDALTIRANAAREAWGYKVKQVNDLSQEQQYKTQSQIDKAAGKRNAAGTIITSAGSIIAQKYGMK